MDRVAFIKNGVFVEYRRNPRKDGDLSKITGLAEGCQYLPVTIEDKPEYDSNFYNLKQVATITEDTYVLSFEQVEKDKDAVCDALTDNLRNYIDTCIPQRKQIDYIATASDIVDKKADGTATEEELTTLAYLKSIQEWQVRISADRDSMVDDYQNNDVVPTFDSWEAMP